MQPLNSIVYGDGGGRIMSSTNGTNFTVRHTVTSGKEPNKQFLQPSNKIYVLCEDATNGEANIYLTTNSFSTVSHYQNQQQYMELLGN